MADNTRRGFESLLYYGTAGSTASNQITNATDITYNIESTKAATTVRGAGSSVPIGYERVVEVKPTLTWTMLNKPSDTSLAALRAAASTGASVAMRYKSYSSGTGFDGDVTVNCEAGAPLNGIGTFNFTATATNEDREATLNS